MKHACKHSYEARSIAKRLIILHKSKFFFFFSSYAINSQSTQLLHETFEELSRGFERGNTQTNQSLQQFLIG